MKESKLWKSSLLTVLLFSSFGMYHAQELESWYVSPGIENIRYQGELFSTPDEQLLFIGSAYFQPALDSGYVAIVKLDHDGNVLGHTEFSLFGLSIFYDAIQVPGGYIISGKRVAGVDTPFLVKIADDLSVDWIKGPSDSDILSEQFNALVFAFGDLNIFSSRNPGQSYAHLIRTAINPEFWAQVTNNTVDESNVRVFEAQSVGNPGDILVLGQIEDAQTGDDETVIMHYEGNDITWAKRIQFEAGDFGNPSDITHLNAGSFILSYRNFSIAENTNIAYLSAVTAEGLVLWSKSYSSSGLGILFGKTIEMASGNMLVSAVDANTQSPLLLKLDPEGNVIWIKEWTSEAPGALGIIDLLALNDGTYRVLSGGNQIGITELNEEGESCNLIDADPLTVSVVNPNMTSFEFGSSLINTVSGDLPSFDRSFDYVSSSLCSINVGLEEESSIQLSLAPNPVQDYLKITNLNTDFEYEVLSLAGRIHLKGKSTSIIDLRNLESGLWIIKLSMGDWSQSYRILKL